MRQGSAPARTGRRLRLAPGLLAAALAIPALPALAQGQEYPNRLVKIVSPFSAGGPTDPPARWMASKLGEAMGQQFIVDFRGGASSNLGTDLVAKSPKDGYTLLFTTNSFILSAVTAAHLPFDTVRDFAPLTPVSTTATLLVVGPSLPVKSLRELLERARQAPGKLSFASSGTGGPLHLYGELLKTNAKVDLLHVPYKGAGPAANDLLGGVTDIGFLGLSGALPLIKAGKITPLAVISARRTAALPDVPTMGEAGVPGFDEVNSRYMMLAPAGTPEGTLNRLHAAIVKVVATPETRDKFSQYGHEAFTTSRAEFAAWLKSQITLWLRIAKAAGVEPE